MNDDDGATAVEPAVIRMSPGGGGLFSAPPSPTPLVGADSPSINRLLRESGALSVALPPPISIDDAETASSHTSSPSPAQEEFYNEGRHHRQRRQHLGHASPSPPPPAAAVRRAQSLSPGSDGPLESPRQSSGAAEPRSPVVLTRTAPGSAMPKSPSFDALVGAAGFQQQRSHSYSALSASQPPRSRMLRVIPAADSAAPAKLP